MKIEMFGKIVRDQKIPDEQVEADFGLLAKRIIAESVVTANALELLKKHRPDVAEKIIKTLATATNNE